MKICGGLSRLLYLSLLSFAIVLPAIAKDAPLQVIVWPSTGTPMVRFTFGKFKQLGNSGTGRAYAMETQAENLSTKSINSATFAVYLFDKNKVRIGQDGITLSNVGPGETVKFDTTVIASGTPVSISIQDTAEPDKTVSITVNSTPQGAMLKVDGVEAGTTPKIVKVGVGKHVLTFSKEGFTDGRFPLDISSDDVSGGTVSYELGASAFDSIELRDGSVLTGDLVSISGMDVEVRVGGSLQHIDRNKIKRVMLTQREAPQSNLPAAAQPNP